MGSAQKSAREDEADDQAIAAGEALVGERSGELAQEPDALASRLKPIDGRGNGRLLNGRGREGIERRSLIFDGEYEIVRCSRPAIDGNGMVRLGAVSVANDVGERFLEAKVNGELSIRRDRVCSGQGLDPGPKQSEIIELTLQGQPGRGLEGAFCGHGCRRTTS